MQLGDSYEAIYRRAQGLVASGEWKLALDEYERIFNRIGKLSPETRARHEHLETLFSTTRVEMVKLLDRLGEYDRILGILGKLMDIAPDARSVWRHQMAYYLIRKGEVDRALAELQALAEEEPNDPFIQLTLGDGFLEKEAYTEAIGCFRRAIDLSDVTGNEQTKAPGYIGLSKAFLGTGQFDEASEAWKAAIALDDSLKHTISLLYDAYLEQGRTQEARALATHDNDAMRRGFFSGMADHLEGNVDVAQRRWSKVFDHDVEEGDESIEYWAEAGLRLGQTTRVIDTLGPLLMDGALNFRSVMLFGIALVMSGDKDRAESLFSVARQNLLLIGGGQLPAEYWDLMDQLVDDEETKADLRHHFEGDGQDTTDTSVSDVAEEVPVVEEPSNSPSESEE